MQTRRKAVMEPMGQKSLLRQIRERWQLFLFVLPAFFYLLLFDYKPMYGIVIAFQDYKLMKGVAGSRFVGLYNFQRLFSSYWFPIILKNTLSISLLSLALSFPLPVVLALMVNEMKSPALKKGFQTISYAPHFVSVVVVCGMVTLFLSPSNGVVNRIIQLLGGEKIAFMQSPYAFKWIYVISGIWQNTGWDAIIYFAALAGVDPQLLEAAEIDGANRVQKIMHVNLPVLVPTIVVLFILQCGSVLGVGYEKVYLLQNATNIPGSEVISTYVYKMGLEKSDFSFSTATGLFNSVANCLILVLVNAISRRIGETSLW
ncbi:MAG: ABC transporter permease subunit [Eubacteriales bacterium]|nr:ABC transporter permease subunit [Eubacteriales bacterium]